MATSKKASRTTAAKSAPKRKPRSKAREPLDVRLSFVVRTGDDPEDTLTVLDEKEVIMVDSVFKYRDKAQRFLALTLVRVAATNKKVMQEIVPALRLINRRKY
jgi:hypothetical protein